MAEEKNSSQGKPIVGPVKGKQIENRQQIKQLIFDLTEEKTAERFSDWSLDRENEKHQLLNGAEFSIREVKTIIQSKARPYEPMFRISYWREMFRLFGWPESELKVFHKKREAAVFINEVIYGRFDKGVLLSLHVLNPYTGYMKRTYKHFQFMTDDGIEKLATVIDEATEMMKECSTYYEFRQKWFHAYGVPYQVKFF